MAMVDDLKKDPSVEDAQVNYYARTMATPNYTFFDLIRRTCSRSEQYGTEFGYGIIDALKAAQGVLGPAEQGP